MLQMSSYWTTQSKIIMLYVRYSHSLFKLCYTDSMKTNSVTVAKDAVLPLHIAIAGIAFAVPFLIPGPQLFTGTIVNALLYLIALKIAGYKSVFFATLPSIGALAHGVLFGSTTLFLYYLLPFIWVSNVLLMKSFIEFKKTLSMPLSVVISAFVKAAFLYAVASLMVHAHIIPQLLLLPMGPIQFVTAFTGGMIAYALVKGRYV